MTAEQRIGGSIGRMNIAVTTRRRFDAVPDAVRLVQLEASNPAGSAFVAANAGSGKTHVLAQRVIRLLLDGVDPARILCITFTKAAAANMANRVFDTLRRWTSLDDQSLDDAIRSACDVAPDAALRARARRLFAVALDTPGGLKVQTIHAFCTRLLHQFPFEANVAARFDVLEDAAQSQLLSQTSLEVLLEAGQHPHSALGRALAMAMGFAADRTFKEVVGEAIRKRDLVRAWIGDGGDVDTAIASLCGKLGIAPAETVEQIDQEIIEGPLLPSVQWAPAAGKLRRGSSNDQRQAERLASALAAPLSSRALAYLGVFFSGNLLPRDQLVTNALQTQEPELDETLSAEQERLLPLLERRKAAVCRDRTAALLTIAEAVIARYRSEKDRRGLLDYDDLIDKSLALLGEAGAAWVHYKLDQGIDHVLIDEAQDTSAKQWEIIRRLTAEFFAGEGARMVQRTVFAVGDEKQSIFSFQNAAPRAFAEMLGHFRRSHEASGLPLAYCRFMHSFRSGANVLAAVDAVFSSQEMRRSIASDPDAIAPHRALPGAPPGLVEIWETIKPEGRREIEAWDAPFDELHETSPPVRLAERIAHHVARSLREGTRPGDVLILVRQRGPLFEAIIRALKEERIPVAGADRLLLTEHIAVMDLMALADALLLPDDDLALATVLKSPLFDLDEDDLFALAFGRQGSLRAALRAKAEGESEEREGERRARFAQAADRLDRLAPFARSDMPFAFYARVLGPERGRRRFLARLGHEADDPLQELLNLALDYERQQTPSLQGFVAWLRGAHVEVKRDMEMARDEVRVMTVHGAKGLEARMVILADTTTPPAGPPQRQSRLLSLEVQGPPQSSPHFVWPARKAYDVEVVRAARDRMLRENEDEHRRLLYVAMTRAIEHLVVCGAENSRRPPDGCWWNLVARALRERATEHTAEDGEGKIWRFCPEPASGVAVPYDSTSGTVDPAVPAWLEQAAPPPSPFSTVSRAPSRAGATVIGASGAFERRKAMLRGTLMHRLLQALPELSVGGRAAAASRFLARAAGPFTADEREEMGRQICRVLDDPRFAPLFLPGSRAELPIVGRFWEDDRWITVSGQIDRIAVTADAVLIADYKTNSPAPRRLEDVPEAYVCQLALYRQVIRQLYPGKAVGAALIWTEIPALMDIPASLMDGSLAWQPLDALPAGS
jgi:ATP-dependent helicase/nuclease subunit A